MLRRPALAHRRVNLILIVQESLLINAGLTATWVALRFPGIGIPLNDWAGAPPVFSELLLMSALSSLMPRRGGGSGSRAGRAALVMLISTLTWWPAQGPQPYLGIALSLAGTLGLAKTLRRPWWREATRVRGPLRELSAALPDWKLRGNGNRPDSRVMVSPQGQVVTLAVARGSEERRGSEYNVRWAGATEGNLRRAPWQGDLLLWIELPSAGGDYRPEQWDELPGTTLIGSVSQAAQWLTSHAGGAVWPSAQDMRRSAKVTRQAVLQLRAETAQASINGLLLSFPGGVAALWPHPGILHPDAGHSRVIEALQRQHPGLIIWAPLMEAGSAPWPGTHTGHASGLIAKARQKTAQSGHNQTADPQGTQNRQRGGSSQTTGEKDRQNTRGKQEQQKTSQPDPEHPRPRSPRELFGLDGDYTPEQLRAAYARLTKQYHPDRLASLGDEFRLLAEEKMKEINAAYEKLKNESRDRTQ